MRYFIIFLFIVSFGGCKSETDSSDVQGVMPAQADSPEEAASIYQYYTTDPKYQSQKEENLIIDYIVDNQIDVQRDESGIYYHIDRAGSGVTLNQNNEVSVHYKGYTLEGREFDSSYKRDKPLTFKVGEMIDGWNIMLKKMRRGDKALVIIPSRYAYGDYGKGDLVGPNDILIFEMHVLDN